MASGASDWMDDYKDGRSQPHLAPRTNSEYTYGRPWLTPLGGCLVAVCEVGDDLDARVQMASMAGVFETTSGVGQRGVGHAGSYEQPGKRDGQLHGNERR